VSERGVVVVGAGIGGLSLAILLADRGWAVKVLEKNLAPGGRARTWSQGGYTFDMGPSWYLMPEVFERFFARVGRTRESAYQLVRLDPSYRVFFSPAEHVDVAADPAVNRELFERLEPGGGRQLDRYLDDATYKYETAMREFVYKEYASVGQFLNRRLLVEGMRLNVLGTLDHHVRRYFRDRRARQLLEYHMVFLGSSPYNAPGMYAIMSHVDLRQGVSYPLGGMGAVVRALEGIARQKGAEILYGHEVDRVETDGRRARAVHAAGVGSFEADAVAVSADYAFTESRLLAPTDRSYSRRYWQRRILAPSFFMLFLGLSKKLSRPLHHTLYLAPNWERHFDEIFRRPAWPGHPCFYLSCTSRTDPGAAPPGGEALVVLVPIASGLDDSHDARQRYRDFVLRHVESVLGEPIQDSIAVERIYSPRDFRSDYNAWEGTGLGLAHTLFQTAVFRPSHRSRKLENLFYTGAYTHPGVGVPMTLISSELVADLMTDRR